ncbi:MAG: AMP-binding protein [Streptosporangiaceae bacterium]
MTSRPLHAVLLPSSAGHDTLAALAAALDGSGPAILPLDPAQPRGAVSAVLEAFAPDAIRTVEGTRPTPVSAHGRPPGVAAGTAVVIATSGSTGEPKGVELSAAALTASASASLRRIGAGPGDRWLCCLPTFYIAGIGVLVRSLIAGTEPVFSAALTPDVLAAAGCQHVSLVPTQLRRLLDAGAAPGPVRTVLLGGAAAPDGLLAEARAVGWRVVTTYGMSETSGGCVYDGWPLDGVSVRAGADGRIMITGPVLFSGYRLQPERTKQALAGGWFRTADLGQVSVDGRVVVRGRADDVINSGGQKVVPGEVEAALGTCAGVADVVVVGVPDADWGEAVTAFLVAADPADPPGADELREHARRALSGYAVPKRFVVVREFPVLASGKPDRVALRHLAAQGA